MFSLIPPDANNPQGLMRRKAPSQTNKQTGLSERKKHQTIETLLMVDFLSIFKMLHFF